MISTSSSLTYVVALIVVLAFAAGVIVVRRSGSSGTGSVNVPVAPLEPGSHARTSLRSPEPTGHGPVDETASDAAGSSERSEERACDEGSVGVEEAGAPSAVESAPESTPEEPAGASLRERSGRTRTLFAGAFGVLRGRGKVDEGTWEELEETLLRADIGIALTTRLLDPLRAAARAGDIKSPDDAIDALRTGMTGALSATDRTLRHDATTAPNVWLFVGVNGVGKTTTIGKIATSEVAKGTKVLLAAGDTFRAAAAEQLQVWSERSGASFVRGAEGGDPASVIFDGIQSAHAKGIDLVLGDTAGRLQNKSNLMEELKKVRRVADKAEGTVNEVLLVIDATTGQNGLSQAREFAAATDVTGVVLTKLDGSAKGGIVFAIETELGIPVKLVGLGEGAHDLVPFDPADYIAALFD